MWSAAEVLAGLVPNCICGASYDLRFCAPHTLPCAHTFCLMCLSKEKQIKTRRCPCCRKKYSSFILNVALAEVVRRVRLRRDWLEQRSFRCDECESRRSTLAMRRCVSCIRDINRHMSAGFTVDCIICLECCVDRHNGHELTALASTFCTPAPSKPLASSTPRKDSQRYLSWRGFVSQKLQRESCESAVLPPPVLPKNKRNHPRVPLTSSIVEEELVYEATSPLYYRISSSTAEKVPHKVSIAKRLSGLIASVTNVYNSISNQEESSNTSKSCYSHAKTMSSGVSSADPDISAYQSISSYAASIPRKGCCSMLTLNSAENLHPCNYVNVYRRRSS